MILSEDKVLLL